MNDRKIAGVKVFVSNETYDEYKGTLQEQINNLQSKIDKAIKYIENNLLPSHSIEKTDWEFEEVIFSDLPVERIKPLIDILKEAENVKNN